MDMTQTQLTQLGEEDEEVEEMVDMVEHGEEVSPLPLTHNTVPQIGVKEEKEKERERFNQRVKRQRIQELAKVIKDFNKAEFPDFKSIGVTELQRWLQERKYPFSQNKKRLDGSVACMLEGGRCLTWAQGPDQICLYRLNMNQPMGLQNMAICARGDLPPNQVRLASLTTLEGGMTESDRRDWEWFILNKQLLKDAGWEYPSSLVEEEDHFVQRLWDEIKFQIPQIHMGHLLLPKINRNTIREYLQHRGTKIYGCGGGLFEIPPAHFTLRLRGGAHLNGTFKVPRPDYWFLQGDLLDKRGGYPGNHPWFKQNTQYPQIPPSELEEEVEKDWKICAWHGSPCCPFSEYDGFVFPHEANYRAMTTPQILKIIQTRQQLNVPCCFTKEDGGGIPIQEKEHFVIYWINRVAQTNSDYEFLEWCKRVPNNTYPGLAQFREYVKMNAIDPYLDPHRD
jgi:hypothetical protein